MKKYIYGFLLVIAACVICTGAGYWFTSSHVRQEPAIPNATIETETISIGGMALKDKEDHEEEAAEPAIGREPAKYYLVAEDGYLLVFCQDKSTVCLYTHMPLTEFPVEEQSKLMEGLWFSNMMDIFSYLESYTS